VLQRKHRRWCRLSRSGAVPLAIDYFAYTPPHGAVREIDLGVIAYTAIDFENICCAVTVPAGN
jgi:hypothetical protein